MAEEGNDGQEKTEDPSQRKIDKSLEEGKVLKSQEVNIFNFLDGFIPVLERPFGGVACHFGYLSFYASRYLTEH